MHHGRRIQSQTPYLHDSLVVEDHGTLTTTYFTARPGRRPVAYVNPVIERPFVFAFWPGPAVVHDGTLQVLGGEEKFRKDATFTYLGNTVATFQLPSLKLLSVRLVPVPPDGDWLHGDMGVLALRPAPRPLVDWAAGSLRDGPYTYIYGTSGSGIYAARVTGTDLLGPWSYYDGHGWTSDPSQVATIEDIPTLLHFSVSKVNGAYLLITSPSSTTNQIVAAFACSPVGPFGPTRLIYTTSEPSHYPSSLGIITYDAHAHPELGSAPGELVLSYDVNPRAKSGIDSPDSSIYRPRFLDVRVG